MQHHQGNPICHNILNIEGTTETHSDLNRLHKKQESKNKFSINLDVKYVGGLIINMSRVAQSV
jgi:hypothetical protein